MPEEEKKRCGCFSYDMIPRIVLKPQLVTQHFYQTIGNMEACTDKGSSIIIVTGYFSSQKKKTGYRIWWIFRSWNLKTERNSRCSVENNVEFVHKPSMFCNEHSKTAGDWTGVKETTADRDNVDFYFQANAVVLSWQRKAAHNAPLFDKLHHLHVS